MFAGITGDGIYEWTKGDYSGGSQSIKYFRGNVDNNWVVFGKDGSKYIWWRIIRNNSNGSLRMIYDNKYVGFKYTSGEVHGNGTNSTILGEKNSADKTTLYGWYNATLKNNYSSNIDIEAGFCND